MSSSRIPVAIVGATGLAGQQFLASLGATGARLVITILHELRRRKKKYGLATACIGGGQGIAMVVESLG